MSQEPIGICLLGSGVVGGGVIRLLTEQAEMLRRRAGLSFELRHVVVRDPKKHAGNNITLPITTDAEAAIDDPKTQIVIELIGGTTTAGTLVERALTAGQAGRHGE